jgi:hypothetical protein
MMLVSMLALSLTFTLRDSLAHTGHLSLLDGSLYDLKVHLGSVQLTTSLVMSVYQSL